MKISFFLSAILVLVGISHSVAYAVEETAPGKTGSVLMDKELFIDAFLQGALLTDEAIVNSLAERENKTTTFAERAYQTRLGRQAPSTFRAGFCLPDDVLYQDVVKTVAESLSSSEVVDVSQRKVGDRVYEILKAQYPCK